jgi:hypothetical protein
LSKPDAAIASQLSGRKQHALSAVIPRQTGVGRSGRGGDRVDKSGSKHIGTELPNFVPVQPLFHHG